MIKKVNQSNEEVVIMPPYHRRAILILGVSTIFLLGCGGSSALERYPDFMLESHYIRQARLMTDVSVIEDIDGEVEKFDIPENQAIAGILAGSVANLLRQKGYTLDSVLPPTLGLFLNPEERFTVVIDTTQSQMAVEVLPTSSPPFSDQALKQDTTLKGILKTASEKFYKTTSVDTISGISALVVLRVSSFNVSFAQRLKKIGVTAIFPVGILYKFPVSWSRVSLQIIDIKSGQTLYYDNNFKQRQWGDRASLLEMGNDLMENLPSKEKLK